MTYSKIIFIYLLVGVATCEENCARYNRSPRIAKSSQNAHWHTFTEVAGDLGIRRDKVNVTVYYETLCPASIDFFLTQLKPVVERLSSHLYIHLIPYGHATTRSIRGRYKFRCQHGQAECYGNMLHACTLHAVTNRTEAVLFNTCLMKYRPYRGDRIVDYIPVLNWCGHKQRVMIRGIWDCMKSDRGSVLLKKYGDETHALRLEYVPYLMLNGSNDERAANNLLLEVCRLLQPAPMECYIF